MHVHTTASDGTATPRQVLEFVARRTEPLGRRDLRPQHQRGRARGRRVRIGVRHRGRRRPGGRERPGPHPRPVDARSSSRPAAAPPRRSPTSTRRADSPSPRTPTRRAIWHKHGLCRGETEVYDCVDFDGVEVANSTPMLLAANFRARKYWRANRDRLAATGGSDAHMLSVIGTSRTLFPGSTAQDLRNAHRIAHDDGVRAHVQPRARRSSTRARSPRSRSATATARRARPNAESSTAAPHARRARPDRSRTRPPTSARRLRLRDRPSAPATASSRALPPPCAPPARLCASRSDSTHPQ